MEFFEMTIRVSVNANSRKQAEFNLFKVLDAAGILLLSGPKRLEEVNENEVDEEYEEVEDDDEE